MPEPGTDGLRAARLRVARGRELLGRAGLAGGIALLAVGVSLDPVLVRHDLFLPWGTRPIGLALGALVLAGWLARGAGGRRALIVLAASVYPVFVPFYSAYVEDSRARFLITMAAVPVTAGLAALAALERLAVRPAARRAGEPE